MENICPGSAQCPIFNGILSDKVTTAKSYRKQFCEGGEVKWSSCKRFMTKKRFGKCPPDLLPNSLKSVDEIGRFYKLS
jgi:hypothetical protein